MDQHHHHHQHQHQRSPSRSLHSSSSMSLASILTRDMQRARPSCDCADEIHKINNAIPTYPLPSTAHSSSSSSATPLSSASSAAAALVPFDDILCAGRMLVRVWERINGCPNANTHQEEHLLRAAVEAAGRVLSLYEAIAGPVIRGRGTTSEYGTPRSNSSTSYYGDSASSTRSVVAYSFSSASQFRAESSSTGPPVFLGTLMLQDEEAAVVAREALRHAVLRLGEVLRDIEEDSGGGAGWGSSATGDEGADDDVRLRGISSRLLRLLGKINSAI